MTPQPHIEVPRATQNEMIRLFSRLLETYMTSKGAADHCAEMMVDEIIDYIDKRPSVLAMRMFAEGMHFAGALASGAFKFQNFLSLSEDDYKTLTYFGDILMQVSDNLTDIVDKNSGPKLDFNEYDAETMKAKVRGKDGTAH